MFRGLLDRKRRTLLLSQSIQDVYSMLENESQMFDVACNFLLHGRETPGVNIHKRDEDINAGERMVRRAVLEHLAINPSQDLPGSLVLLNIVIYVERIGDYTKEIWQLGEKGIQLGKQVYLEQLQGIQSHIEPMFQWCIRAFCEDDVESGNKVMVRKREIETKTDALLDALLANEKLNTAEGIAYALAGRYMRRISAHLSNIASSTVAPMDKIGFDEES